MDKQFKERLEFIEIYQDFDRWLLNLGFTVEHSSTPQDYHYSSYNNLINSLYSVEHYINKRLGLSLRFLRDRNKHMFMVVGDFGSCSDIYSIDEFQQIILDTITILRDKKLKELEFFNGLETFKKFI